jgi:glutaminase
MKQISHSGRRINGDKPLLSGQIVHQTFTIQSISKAFVFGLALEDNGIDAMEARVDIEPSGETQADRSIQ